LFVSVKLDSLATRAKVNTFLFMSACLSINQEVQLSPRDRAMLRVIEYVAKSLKVTQGQSK